MREYFGNIWAEDADAYVVTTNGIVRHNKLVMGAGIAKQVAQMYPTMPVLAGQHVTEKGNVPGIFKMSRHTIVTYPTKHDYKDSFSDIKLISDGAEKLVKFADEHHWKKIVMPRPGVGFGHLKWEDVKNVIGPVFDNRFVVMEFRRKVW